MPTTSVMLYKTAENNVKGAAGKSNFPVLFTTFFGYHRATYLPSLIKMFNTRLQEKKKWICRF